MRRHKQKNKGLRSDVRDLIKQELHSGGSVLSKAQLEKLNTCSASVYNRKDKLRLGSEHISSFLRSDINKNFEKKIGNSIVTYVIKSVMSKLF